MVIWYLAKGWAALLSERYEEAIEFTERAREANPEFPDIYAVLASANGQLGNTAGARSIESTAAAHAGLDHER